MTANRTEILRVHPIDVDGPLRESLVSLIARIADANCTSPAILLERKYSSGDPQKGPKFTSRAMGEWIGQAINGSQSYTEFFVARTEELTQLENLRASTTLNFARFCTINGLLRSHLAWGPGFLQQSKVAYYPLLWSLEAVRVCPKKRRPLMSLCPSCRKKLLSLSSAARVGRCNLCGAELGIDKSGNCPADPVANKVRDLEYEVWVANQLGDFIQFQTRNTLPEDFVFGSALNFWLRQFELRLNSRSADMLGAKDTALKTWASNGVIPRLRMTLNLCWVFGISLLDFLHSRIPSDHDGRLREPADRTERFAQASRRSRIDRGMMRAELKSILQENRYAMMPFAEICRKKLGRRDLVVRQTFPEEARAIARRFLENRRLIAEAKRNQFCALIETIARFLHVRGIVPNHKTLGPYVDNPNRLRCDWAIVTIKKIRAELGYEDSSEQLELAI